jgi:hypothetical protein
MLIRSSEIRGCRVEGSDGLLGTIDDLYFDGYRWLVDYLVINMGGRAEDRPALLAPSHIEAVEWKEQRIIARTTRESLQHGPQIQWHATVGQQVDQHHDEYLWWPPAAHQRIHGTAPGMPGDPFSPETDYEGKPFLRSDEEIAGYVVEAIDGRCGRLLSLLIDDRSWRVQSLLIDPTNWSRGPLVQVPVNFVDSFDWLAHTVRMNAMRDRIRKCAAFGESQPDANTAADTN